MNGFPPAVRRLATLALSSGLLLLLVVGTAGAQPVPVPETWGGSFTERPRATGSWGGLRDELGARGVVLDLDLLVTPQVVARGGRDDDFESWGNAEYTLNVDTQKLGLWPGGFLRVKGTTSFGNSIQRDAGGILPVNSALLLPEPEDNSSALLHATFTQFLSPHVGVTLGKLFTLEPGSNDFSGSYRTQFLNSALTMPFSFALVPISAYGGGLIVVPRENVVLSVLALDPRGTPENDDVGDAFDDGVMLLASGEVKIEPFGRRGLHKVGLMWSDEERLSLEQDPDNIARLLLTERFPLLGDPGPLLARILERFFPALLVPTSAPHEDEQTWAFFYGLEQYLWHPEGDTERGIGVFFNFGVADEDSNPIEYSYSVGIGGQGAVPGRPDDAFGIGWARTEFSDDFLPFLRRQLDLGLRREDVYEVYYNVALTSWLNATLDVQVVESALEKRLGDSGLEDMDTAVIGGMRLYVRF